MIRDVRALCAGLAVAVATLGAGPAPARATSVYAPDATVDGKTVDQWTEGWWTWAAGLPANHNAFNDPTGVFAHQQNSGPVFYLPGYFSLPAGYTEPPVQRSLTVRAGEPILVSLVNLGAFQFSKADEAVIMDSLVGNNLTATIDGKPVPDLLQYREETDFFSAGRIKPNSIGSTIFATPGFPGIPPDCSPSDLCPGLAAGYWLMLNLSPGVHQIDTGGSATFDLPADFGGGTGSISAATDYTITVPGPVAQAIALANLQQTSGIAPIPEAGSALLALPWVLGAFALMRRPRRTAP
jgi:hypothetical protein